MRELSISLDLYHKIDYMYSCMLLVCTYTLQFYACSSVQYHIINMSVHTHTHTHTHTQLYRAETMASIRKHYREPVPQSHPFAADIGMKIYRWTGRDGSREKQFKVDVFDPIRESWKQFDSRGDTPVAECCGASASYMNDMYTFGGTNGEKHYEGLHKLDTTTMRWTYISPRGSVHPSAKTGCRMVAIPGKRLALLGGYTPKVVKKNKSPFQKNTSTGGTCNELHVFDIERSEFS